MKNQFRYFIVLGSIVLLALLAALWLRSTHTAPKSDQAERPPHTAETPAQKTASVEAARSVKSASKKPVKKTASVQQREDTTEFGRFNQWVSRYLEASEEQRRGLVNEGLDLAATRRTALKRVIEADPRRAIENAVPPVVRQQLPAEIVVRLEERVNEEAFYGVLGVAPSAEYPKTVPYRREVRTDDGGRYRAFVYGGRLSQPTTEKTSIVGIAVDDTMAIDERRLRTVDSGEIPNHPNNLTRRRTATLKDEQGFTSGREVFTTPAPARDIVETCPVSGQSTVAENPEKNGAVSTKDIVVEAGGKFHFLCSGGHINAYEDQMIAREGGNGGPVLPTSPPSATQSTGYKTHLLMRIAFPEALKGIMTEKEGHDYAKGVQDWFIDNSYGAMTFMTTVTPLIIMPRSEAWYKDQDTDGGANEVLIDARVAAKAAGYDPANFNFDTVIYNGPGSFGGQAYVGGKGCWMRTTNVGVACHEYGHNFGLWHANFWTTTNGSAIGGGSHSEYGDSFDTMGSANAGDYHFNACHKNLLNWIPNALVHDVTSSGTYRIYQMDQPAQNPRLRYAIKTRKDADRDYWVDLRQLFASNAWVQGGVFLHWSPWATSEGGAHLLDTTPGSIDAKNDAPIVIGRTFSDTETGIHITPIAKNTTTPPSADVVVNLGMFPGNSAPVVAVGASVTSEDPGDAIVFTATASDIDGDVLSYAWDFGDKSFSTTNSPVVSKSWSTAGEYRVRCTASDMKGKTASSSVIVTIGSTSTFRISGTITAGGQPLANVRVHNSLTGSSYREAYTDANGTYTLTRLTAGTYTVAAQLYGYTLTPTGSASVAVGPSASGKNFTAADLAQVSIAVQDADCAEGTNTGSFRISRTGSTAAALAVSLYAPSGSAAKPADYSLAPDVVAVTPFQTFTIAAGQTFLDVVATAANDTGTESFESVILELVPSTNYIIGTGIATLWIGDGDTANALVRLRVADRDADESGDAAQFTIERIGSTSAALNVVVALTGTATNGTDYANIPTTITIPEGASSAPVNVSPLQDTAVEALETITLTISTNAAYTRVASSADYAGTVNLHDDDQPILSVVATDSVATEAGNDPGVFTVTRTGSTASALTLNYGITGSALHGTDYVPLPGVLTIPAGSSVGAVVITPIDDAIGEPAQTAVFQLRGGTGYTVGAVSNATVTINDGDLPYASIAVTTGPAIEGSTAGVFRVTTTGTGSGNITVRYTVSGTATSGTDFTALAGTLTIAKNTTANLSIATIQDSAVEGYETVTITLDPDPAYSLALDSAATMNLQDDEAPQVNVSTTDDAFTETNGSLAKFFISRTGSTTNALTVNYTLGGTATAGSDYTAPSGSVVIAAGATGAFLNISMLDDSLAEGTESIIFNLTPDAAYSAGIGSATRYITDAEAASLVRQVRFSAGSSSAAESAATVNIIVTLDAAAADTVKVDYFINGGTALASGVDYTLAANVLTFAPGETTKNITVALNDDTNDEGNETLIIALANPINAKLGTSSHTLTITDSDTPPGVTVGFAGATGNGLESQSTALLTVALSTAQGSAVTVDYAVTGGTATGGGDDYTITSGTLTFAAGETVKVIPNTIVDDASAESNETIILTLSNPVGAALNANALLTYTITDDDAATVTISATDADATEPGSDTGLFTVTRTGATTAALTVNFNVSGSATIGSDYANIANSVVIATGESSATVLVSPLDDNAIEPPETVILTLAPGVYTIGAESSATATIVDNESSLLVTITASDADAAEQGNPGAFTVSRTGSTASELTVNLGIAGTATTGSDYTALATSVIIPAASASVVIPVSPLIDALNEGDETVILTVIAGSGYSVSSPASATVTIVNSDDGSPPTLVPTSFVDDKGGASVFINTLVTYTVTFSKDMDASTVTAVDFGNAGTATFVIGTVAETSFNSGVFSVQATPTSAGTLQLRVNAGAELKSVAGTDLNTVSAIADNTIITAAGFAPTLADALDTTGLTWTGSGDANWIYQTTITKDGIDAAKSGVVDHSQNSYMETTVVGPGSLTFWWKVSSENNYDYLRFYLDGAEQTTPGKISGEVDWVQNTVSIVAGSHTIKWGYTKDDSVVAGSDAAWVDQVVFTPAVTSDIAVEQPVGTNLVDGSASINGGPVSLGSSSSPITVTVKNTGTADLTGLVVSKDGTHNADFSLGSLGATTLVPDASTTFTVTFSPSATGVRTAAIHIASNDPDENPFDIALTGTGVPLGTLAVTPAGNFTSSGSFGGPFAPATLEYTLSNTGSTSIDWTASKTAAWVDINTTSGTLAAGASATITASINANANPLVIGGYSDTVTFTNTTTGNGNTTRGVSLTVNLIPATFNFSDLLQTYSGSARSATVTTNPIGLAHSVTYGGSATLPTNVGTYAVVATITEPNYTGSGSASLVIAKAPQSIIFNALDPIADDQPPFALTATATSELSVSYASSNTAVATISGSTVTIVGLGSADITATQAGDANYNAAAPAVQTLTVVRSNPLAVISGGPFKLLYGQSLSLNGSASQPSYNETITTHEWDLNNDDIFGDVTEATPAAISFAALTSTWGMVEGLNTIKLKITDSANKTSIISTTVNLVFTLTWDANGTTAGQTNGAGAWLGTNLWWDGAANQTWATGSNATFGGPNTAGGAVTLASPTTVNSLAFNTFTGTYTLGTAGQAITLNTGITKNAGAGIVTIVSPLTLGGAQTWTNNSSTNLNVQAATTLSGVLTVGGSGITSFDNANAVIGGSGGIIKNGTGQLNLSGGATPLHSFTGDITVNGGSIGFQTTAFLTGRNVNLTNGYLGGRYGSGFTWTSGLGTGANQIQITGGTSGFSGEGSSGSTFVIGTALSTLKWGATGENGATGFFNPAVLLANGDARMNTNGNGSLNNGIDLNGTTRTITSLQTTNGAAGSGFTISGVISNSSGTAGLIKTGVGNLILGNANTYNGDTTISGGTLQIGNNTAGSLGNGTYNSNISIAGGAALRIYSTASQSLGGVISGGGGLVKSYAGTLTLANSNTYTGKTSLTPQTTAGAGTVIVSSFNSVIGGTSSSSLGAPTTVATGTIDFGNTGIQGGATLRYTGSGETTDRVINFLFNGTGATKTIEAAGSGLLKFTSTFTGSGSVSNDISLTGTSNGEIAGGLPFVFRNLSKAGTGTWTLGGTSNHTGTTTITAGKLALGGNNVLPDATAVSIANAILDGVTYSDTLGTLDVTSTAKINLDAGAALAFADSSAVDWTGGTLNLTGTFVPGSSLRFGTSNTALTSVQLTKISAAGFGALFLDADGYLSADTTLPTLAGSAIVDDKAGGLLTANTLVTYTVTFSEDMDATSVSAVDFGNAGSASVSIGAISETAAGVFSVQVTPTSGGTLQLQVNQSAVLKDVAGNNLDTAAAILDDTTITVDGTAPTVVSIVDDKAGAPITANTLVTYTVTFSEDMDATSVSAVDFGNAGSASVSIGAISETAAGVFSVQVTPTSGGTLQLRVNEAAVLKDVAGNNLDTAAAILDDTTITVDGTAPTVVSIVDDKAGAPITVNTLVTYTVTFSEDMDATSVSAVDFGNAGSAAITIGAISETAAGVFSVQVTPTSGGTLQLRVNEAAVLKDVAGNNLDTAAAILDDTTITVDGTAPTVVSIVDDKAGGLLTANTLVTYTVTFSEDMDATSVSAVDFGNAGSAAITIGAISETAAGVFSVQVTPTSGGTLQLRVNEAAVLKDVAGNNLDTAAAILDDTTITVDGTAPTVVSIVDDKAGGLITANTLVTYTVTFSEDMDATSVSAVDFGNAGSASVSIGAISETAAGVFSVQVTPTSGGTLQLQVNQSAVLKDVAGNNLDTAAAILDDTTITVDGTAPTVVSIVDDKAGAPITVNTLVTYTVTFSEDMDATSVSAVDFGNAGSAAITIGAISETAAGVFSVQVTPTSGGTLQLRVNEAAVLKDVAGNNLDTAAAILDDTTITVDGTAPTVVSIVDDKAGGLLTANTLVTYTVTFSEDMDATSVSAVDFGNAGSAAITIGAISETAAGVFSVQVTPTSGGTLQLRVNEAAVLKDVAGNNLDTAAAILDDTTITVDGTAPTVVSIVDDKAGAPITANTLVTYTVTFSEDMDATSVSAVDFGNAGSAAITIGAISETAAGVFSVQVTPTSGGTLQLRVNEAAVLKDVAGNNLDTAAAILDDTTITVDGTAPTVVSIVDDKAGGLLTANTLVTYTVTFSEDMDATSVSAVDFGNAGSASVSIGAISETAAGVFSVQVTPTSGGTLQLQVNQSAVLKDVAGNNLDTAAAILDDTTITVDGTAPTVVSIVDDKAGAPITVNTLVTYTVTFSEDMDATSVSAVDFGNAGSAAITIGAISETAAGVFSVQVTPTSGGTLQLRVNEAAVLKDVAGNNLDTAAAILDDTTITVDGTAPTVVSIVDDKAGGLLTANTLVTYTVTFSEDMDATSVSAVDFGNAGSASVSIGAISETAAGVFSVQVTPTSGGTLQLQVNQSAVLKDVAGNNLDTAAAILDDTTITVDGTAPTVVSIVDDKAGAPITVNTLVTYTVTFSEDMDATSVSAVDFGNAGSAAITIGAISETAAGVFSVQVTPTSGGTLQLRVNEAAVLKDVAGNNLDTAAAILDDTTIIVQDSYAAWSGGAGFDTDGNGDGVANGVAWVLGATDTAENASGLLPVFDNITDANYVIYTYRRSDAANADTNTTIAVEYTSALGAWTTALHNGTNIIITTTNDIYGANPGIDKVEVKIKRTLIVGGQVFLRLNVTTLP